MEKLSCLFSDFSFFFLFLFKIFQFFIRLCMFFNMILIVTALVYLWILYYYLIDWRHCLKSIIFILKWMNISFLKWMHISILIKILILLLSNFFKFRTVIISLLNIIVMINIFSMLRLIIIRRFWSRNVRHLFISIL